MRPTSPFLTPLAVDTWDAHFRWREGGRLRDVTIDATWGRVARALANGSIHQERQLIDAFASWQLLPDERLIARAGTGYSEFGSDPLAAVLNVAAFVRSPHAENASFDNAAFESKAGLAVRVLDGAATLSKTLPCAKLRVGVIGLADAMKLMNFRYGEADACAFARRISQALWRGCAEESTRLLIERGQQSVCDAAWIERAHVRGLRPELIETCRRTGLRHRDVTAITSQQKLALLANCVADALDPVGVHCRPTGKRQESPLPTVPLQLRVRAAMQPWIDEPIDYPVTVCQMPEGETLAAWRALAAQYDLGEFKLQTCGWK